MSDVISKEQFRKKMEKLTVPEGFTFEIEEDTFGYSVNSDKWLVGILKSETVEMRFSQVGAGTTNYLHDGSWFTFDRRGVEASFYWYASWGGKPKSLNAIVKEQIEKIAETLKYYETAVQIPGIPFTVSPERVEQLKKRLQKMGSISFMPSGFGTGYVIGTRKQTHTDKRASSDLEEFFNMSPLYLSTFDAD